MYAQIRLRNSEVHMKRNTVRQAMKTSIPIMAGYLFLGFGFGVLLEKAGYGPLWALAMSLLIYGGTMQYVGVGLLAGGASIVTTIVTSLMVNARHLFYSISMVHRYRGAGRYKPYLIFALTDETYSLLSDDRVPEGVDLNLYRFLVSLFNHSYWIAGCVLGNVLGSVLPFSAKGIDFSMTALFVAAFAGQWITADSHIPALTGLIGTLLCLLIFGADNFLIPAMLLITLILTLLRSRRQNGKEVSG